MDQQGVANEAQSQSEQEVTTIENPESHHHKSIIDRGNLHDLNQDPLAGIDDSINTKMAPKPEPYGSAEAAVDSEASLLAATEAGGVKRMTDHNKTVMAHEEEDFDDASSLQSDYTDTEGEESAASSTRRERERGSRRSKRRGSSRRKHRKSRRSSSRDHYSSDYDDDDEGSRRRSSSRSRRPKEEVDAAVEEEQPGMEASSSVQSSAQPRSSSATVTAASKGNHQPYVKLLNFQTLYRAEQDRCPLFTEELEKVTEHWNVCKEILQRLVDEVRHANHLFHVSDVSFHQYSHVMYTIHKDIFLDDQGKRVLSSARQQLLLKQRGANNTDAGREEEKNSFLENSGGSGGYLDPLYNSFSVLTDTMMRAVLERESDDGKQAAALEFLEFSEELLTQAQEMEALGNSVVQEMEGSEMDIQNSFRVLEQLAAKIKGGKTANVLDDDITLGKPNKKFPKEMPYGGVSADVGDWWMWETLYRAAVKHQETSWNGNYERLQGLEESLRYVQEKHQNKLEKAVLAVMPEQRELFLQGAKAFETALKKTSSNETEEGVKVDRESIADEFEAGVQQRSSSLLKRKTFHKSAILNRSRSRYNTAIEQADSLSSPSNGDVNAKQLPAFGSPVLSKLVLETKVLERWDKAGWMTTIAVFTVDKFLHLFDCEDLDTKTLPQTAFASMFPTTASSRAGVHHQGGGRRKAKTATDHKVPDPSLTFNLLTCTLKTYGYSRRSFELKQVADPTAKNDDLPHTTLRFKDFREATRWFSLLQDLPDPMADQESETVEPTEPKEVSDAQAHALYDEIDAARKDAGKSSRKKGTKDTGAGSDDGGECFEDASEYFASDDGSQEGEGDMFMDASEHVIVGDDITGIASAHVDEKANNDA